MRGDQEHVVRGAQTRIKLLDELRKHKAHVFFVVLMKHLVYLFVVDAVVFLTKEEVIEISLIRR